MLRGGVQTRSTDGVIGIEDAPLIVYAVAIDSGATQSIASLHNGDAAGDTQLFQAVGSPNRKIFVEGIPSGGLYFSDGCFVDVDANLGGDGISVWYEHIRNTV